MRLPVWSGLGHINVWALFIFLFGNLKNNSAIALSSLSYLLEEFLFTRHILSQVLCQQAFTVRILHTSQSSTEYIDSCTHMFPLYVSTTRRQEFTCTATLYINNIRQFSLKSDISDWPVVFLACHSFLTGTALHTSFLKIHLVWHVERLLLLHLESN